MNEAVPTASSKMAQIWAHLALVTPNLVWYTPRLLSVARTRNRAETAGWAKTPDLLVANRPLNLITSKGATSKGARPAAVAYCLDRLTPPLAKTRVRAKERGYVYRR
jgi:hypothetical protein